MVARRHISRQQSLANTFLSSIFVVFTVHSTHKPKVMKEHNVVSQTCLVSRCRTDVFDDCAAPRLFVDIVKLPLKPPPLCVACSDMQTMKYSRCRLDDATKTGCRMNVQNGMQK